MNKSKSDKGKKDNIINPKKGLWVKRNALSGKFVSSKNEKPFRGIRKEALDKLAPTLNRLARYDKESS